MLTQPRLLARLSLFQKDPALFDPNETPDAKPDSEQAAFINDLKARRKFFGGAAYEASRTDEEKEAFQFALTETMDLWYSHQGTTVYMLTILPEGTLRTVGYDDSGWTTYERHSAEQIKKVWLRYAPWKLVLDLGAGEDAYEQAKGRNWPMDPDGFDVLVETKSFTNGADKEAVKKLFRKMSIGQLSGVTKLDFQGMSPPLVSDAAQLGRCLSLCKCLAVCSLNAVELTDEGGTTLFSILNTSASVPVKVLLLMHNKLGARAAIEIAAFLRASSQLEVLR